MLPLFKLAAHALMQKCGIDEEELLFTLEDGKEVKALTLGALKDPIRVFEKAADDYADRFKDVLPEACVMDVLRGRVVCSTGEQMLAVQRLLLDGFAAQVEEASNGQNDVMLRLELLRCKNSELAPSLARAVANPFFDMRT